MPELGWRFGYPAVMLGMASVTLVLVVYFRQERWL
jgi:magnesium transporter